MVWQRKDFESGASPFGMDSISNEGDVYSGVFEMPFRFPGQYSDVETGTFYNYYRDYNPILGRYLQSDPIGLKGGWNTYSYVGGNPINYIDPLGLETNALVFEGVGWGG